MRHDVKRMIIAATIAAVVVSLSACEWLHAEIAAIKDELIGNSYDVEFYDNSGGQIHSMNGNKIGLSGNIVDEITIGSDGGIITKKDAVVRC